VARTGQDTTAGGTSPPPLAVSFSPVEEANRANHGTDPYLYRNRIGQVTTEAGAQITVTYELPDSCEAPNSPPSDPASNHSSCFPVYWQNFTPPNPDWFNKWAVKSVQVSDPAGGSPGLYTSYTYSRAAWHYDDNEVVKTKYRTYGQWRGYQDVQTFTGGGDPQTETETTYYQGMSDDNNTTDVTVPDSQQKNHEDANQLAGNVLESTAYTYPGGPVDHSTIYSYYVSPAVTSRDRSAEGLADDPLTANFTGQVEQWSQQAITDSSPATWRDTETDTHLAAARQPRLARGHAYPGRRVGGPAGHRLRQQRGGHCLADHLGCYRLSERPVPPVL
jgi:hypothetical protein